MAQRSINWAIQRHYQRAKTLGKAAGKTWAEDDIHRFRVEVKKLRACLRLAGATRMGLDPRLPGKLRAFYDMVGVIRCLQLQRKGLVEAAVRMEMELPEICSSILDDRIQTAVAVGKAYLQLRAPLGKPRSEWQVPVHRHRAIVGVDAFLKAGKDDLLVGDVLPDEAGLHALRKVMKDILYTAPYFPEGNALSCLPTKFASKAALEMCVDKLGEFHDICLQLQLLKDNSSLAHVNSSVALFLEATRQLWQQDKAVKLGALRTLLLPFIETGQENPLSPSLLNAESFELHID
jgi:CHAD domain-containing protein